jgi:PadR family transcriptional regulator PadR
MDRELKRGTLEMIIMALLAEEPMYGFQFITEMETRSGGGFEMKEGTLYPVLYRMEENGLVESKWEAEGRGVPRKYYHITTSGKKELERLLQEWSAFTSVVAKILRSADITFVPGRRRA